MHHNGENYMYLIGYVLFIIMAIYETYLNLTEPLPRGGVGKYSKSLLGFLKLLNLISSQNLPFSYRNPKVKQE